MDGKLPNLRFKIKITRRLLAVLSLLHTCFHRIYSQAVFGDGVNAGEELVARKRDSNSKWCVTPHGLACRCVETFTWPEHATRIDELGSIQCELRTEGAFNEYNVQSIPIMVEGLVFANDWILARHSNGLTVRGAPVTRGSPLCVGVQAPSTAIFVAGSVLEMDLERPELYKRGKVRVTVLLVGILCSKKQFDDNGAIFHVSNSLTSF